MNVFFFLSIIALVIYCQAVIIFLFTMPRSRVNGAFIAASASLAWFSAFVLLIQMQDEISKVYLFDGFAVLGWATFPVLLTILFLYLDGTGGKKTERIVFYFLVPLSVAIISRYLYDPQTIKMFYKTGDHWFFTVNLQSPWSYLFLFYLIACGLISFMLLYRRTLTAKTNREKLQARVVFFSLVVFFFFSLLTNVALPFGSRQTLPAMAHINFSLLIIGVFVSLSGLQLRPFSREMTAHLVHRNLGEFVFYLDPSGYVLDANQFSMDRLGYPPTSIRGMDPGKLFGDSGEYWDVIHRVKTSRSAVEARMELFPESGPVVDIQATVVPVFDQTKRQSGIVLVGIYCEETQRMQRGIRSYDEKLMALAEHSEKLEVLLSQRGSEVAGVREQFSVGQFRSKRVAEINQRELKEKEQLIQEIHHRVKNNMQMVISLVNMLRQQKDICKPAADELAGIAERIRGISAIHEDFYSTPYLSKINFGQFLHKATGTLNSQVRQARKIFFNLNVANEILPVDQAIPCALVFQELLLNALRHAFPEEKNSAGSSAAAGMIGVEFFLKNGEYTLIVSDNGQGFPGMESKNFEQASTGLRLVHILVREHLKGVFEIKQSFGTRAVLRFKRQDL